MIARCIYRDKVINTENHISSKFSFALCFVQIVATIQRYSYSGPTQLAGGANMGTGLVFSRAILMPKIGIVPLCKFCSMFTPIHYLASYLAMPKF